MQKEDFVERIRSEYKLLAQRIETYRTAVRQECENDPEYLWAALLDHYLHQGMGRPQRAPTRERRDISLGLTWPHVRDIDDPGVFVSVATIFKAVSARSLDKRLAAVRHTIHAIRVQGIENAHRSAFQADIEEKIAFLSRYKQVSVSAARTILIEAADPDTSDMLPADGIYEKICNGLGYEQNGFWEVVEIIRSLAGDLGIDLWSFDRLILWRRESIMRGFAA